MDNLDFDIYDDEALLGPRSPTAVTSPPPATTAAAPLVPLDQPGTAVVVADAAAAENAQPAQTGLDGEPNTRKRRASATDTLDADANPRPAKMAVLEAVNDDDDVFAGYGESKLPEAVAAPVPAAPAVVEPTLPAKPTDPAPHVDPNVNVAALPVVPHEVLSDPSATSALQIDELTWWTTDKDIADISALVTGDSQCIVDMTFNEHKTNGKSRGSVYVQFTSSDAAARTKYQFESIEIDGRMPTVRFADPAVNPFRVLPKESIHASNGVTGGNHVMGGAGRGGGMRSGPGFQQQQQQQGPYQQQQQGYGVGAGYMGGYAQPPPHQMHYPGGPPPPGAMYGQYNGGGGPQYGAYRPPPHYQQQQQQYGAAPVGGYGNQGMGRPAYGPTSGIPARPTYGPGGGTPASLS